jgi:succinate-semialdehyde dehydrogenase/glutarate-semialdehyde dehydrogenase
MAYETINPATGKKIKTFDQLSDADMKMAIEKADQTLDSWKQTSFSRRADLLKKIPTVHFLNVLIYQYRPIF